MANQGQNRPTVRPVGNTARPATGAQPNTARPAGAAARPKTAGTAGTASRPEAGKTAVRQPQRAAQSGRALTPEEIARRREAAAKAAARREAEEKAKKEAEAKAAAEKKARKQKIADIVYRVVAVLIVAAVLALLVWGGVTLLRKLRSSSNEKKPGPGAYTMESAAMSFDGVPYLNFTELARHYDFRIVGGKDSTRFSVNGTEARIDVGFRTATVEGETVTMAGPALYLDGSYWVPVEFVSGHVRGLLATVLGEHHVLSRTTEPDENGEDVEVPLSFSAERVDGAPDPVLPVTDIPSTEPQSTEPPVTEDPDLAVINSVTFLQDLSAYEAYMNPTGDARDAYLVLVNKTEKVTADLIPSPVVKLNTDYTYNGRKVEMQETAAKAMEAMFKELFKAGYTDMHVTSGYRSYEYQVSLYNEYVSQEMADNKKLTKAEAEAIVDTYSARAGTSEHQTGLCADMHNLSSADVKFAKKDAYKWLCENAWKFGFVLRFPEDKVDITGYSFEPWHWRFVGRYHAYKIWQEGLCLEEYLETLE